MTGLIGRDEFVKVVEPALDVPGADGVEVLFMHQWGGLTRFAGSMIHQSTAGEDTGLSVRVVRGGRIGVASSNDFTQEGARAAAISASEMAAVAAPDPLWPGFAPPAPIKDRPEAFDEPTASVSPAERARGVGRLVGNCAEGFTAAGAFETTAVEMGLINTEGQGCWAPFTQASLTTVISGGDGGSGFAEDFAIRAEDIDPDEVGGRASDKAVRSQRPRTVEPGIHTVVLEPSAVATLVGFLAYVGFGGRAYVEGRSCFSGKEGEVVGADAVTIYDDASDPGTIGTPFDFEGVPRRRVELISDGVFKDVVYDLRTAKLAGDGKSSTGHALPPPNPDGPFPLNLSMSTGSSTLEEMIAATDRGILVTRFHYSNIVNPIESSITGMTRDGTFLIEHGEIAGPVVNFRMTQSIIDALKATTMIGDRAVLASEFFFSASQVPALKIEEFNFSGRSDH
jgi:PmbA protein